MRCNYKTENGFEDSEFNPNSNINGTNECSFLDSKVTSIVYANSSLSTVDELIVGGDVFDNDIQPFAKMIDLDVDVQGKSVIYGMKIGVRLANGEIAFKGDSVPNVVSQDYWLRVKCYGPTHSGEYPFDASFALGAQATTRITNITWNQNLSSPLLQELKSFSEFQNGELSMRLSFYFYTRSYQPFLRKNFTLAHIIGSIGIAKHDESLNFAGERILAPTIFSPPNKVRTDIQDDSCYQQKLEKFSPWLFKAPFRVDYTTKSVTIDLSNSLPVDMHGSLKDIGAIHLGIFVTTTSQYPEFCVSPVSVDPIPYLEENWLQTTNGIVTYLLNNHHLDDLKSSKMVIFQEITEQDDINDLGVPFCGEVFHSFKKTHLAQVLIEESQYYIRPQDTYVNRMEYGGTHNVTLLVTEYGLPMKGIPVELKRSNPDALPSNGLVPEKWIVKTDDNGRAVFKMVANEPVPYPRGYVQPPCPGTNDSSLPIDGQIYLFKYCIQSQCPPSIKYLFVSELSFLVFSTVNYTEPYTWVDHVRPIFSQYYHLNRAMALVLNLSDYYSVIKPSNIRLIKLAMSLEFNNPNFMPVTRDLSPTKTKMILNWLDDPIYSTTNKQPTVTNDSYQKQETNNRCRYSKHIVDKASDIFPRCQLTSIPTTSHPADTDPYFNTFVRSNNPSSLPLSGSKPDSNAVCTLDNIRSQLQIGIEVKLHSIPLYLTALYSVVDDCNNLFYDLFLNITLQEMSSLYSTGLLLHLLDGEPNLSSLAAFPRNGFPGGVMKGLEINLEKASLRHFYKLFLTMNLPKYQGIDGLYTEIVDCFQTEDFRKIVDEILLKNTRENLKNCKSIQNTSSAIDLIKEIAPDNENDKIHDILFYKIEELVCERKLAYLGDGDNYAYSGDSLPFNNEGVWPMMSNPNWDDIELDTNCYTKARVFNQVYKKLLFKIQQSFTSETDMYFEAIQLMKSLHVHFKKVLWTEKNSSTVGENCGPVFN